MAISGVGFWRSARESNDERVTVWGNPQVLDVFGQGLCATTDMFIPSENRGRSVVVVCIDGDGVGNDLE